MHRSSPVEEANRNALLRALPSIDDLLKRPLVTEALSTTPRARVVQALRDAVGEVRSRILNGELKGLVDDDVRRALDRAATPKLRPVLNATGVVLHTNLGRAPLAREAVDRVAQVAAGYSTLEYDVERGERGSRFAPVVDLLRTLTGAEDALVVNNNAAAVLLALSALAHGRAVVVSRGELVEIGGGFRIPDVMAQSGATLREVGTTNRTRRADYENAVSPDVALLAKIHRSNFEMIGFTEDVSSAELVAIGRAHGVPVFEDLGSGALVRSPSPALAGEPTVRAAVEAGVDVVSFSGDKLLGGPQAGILVGRAELLRKLHQHPLHRALRVDKLTVAALEATLELYRDERFLALPAWRMLHASAEELRAKAEALQRRLGERGVRSTLERTESEVGGGALPAAKLPSFACALTSSSAAALQTKLREGAPPVIARIVEERVLLDVRCVPDEALDALANAVRDAVLGERPC